MLGVNFNGAVRGFCKGLLRAKRFEFWVSGFRAWSLGVKDSGGGR